jgi:hypothetical protein
MIFKGIRNQTVVFKIIDYELPENVNCTYEANWLYIDLNVVSDFGNWQTDDAALSTTDVEKTIEWFNNLSQNKAIVPQLSFMKKGITFELIKNSPNKKQVRIHFYSECRPKHTDHDEICYVDLELNNLELKEVSENLEKELKPYPTRGFE